MRRLTGLVLILALLCAAALTVFAYFGDLPAVRTPVEAPATGVGFDG